MTDINKLIDGYDAKLKALDTTQSKTSSRLDFVKFAVILNAAIGGTFMAVHFALAAMHDREPYDQAKAEIQAQTFLVPTDYYKNDREKCIRHQLVDNESLDLGSLSQDEVLKLSDEFPDKTESCIDEDSRSNMNYQEDYLKTLAPPTLAGRIGGSFIGGCALYLGGMAYYRRRRSKTQAAIKNTKDSKFLLG
jgi:hypothetical protein